MQYGEEIKRSAPILMTRDRIKDVSGFHCGDKNIDAYLKEEACYDSSAVTYIVKEGTDEDETEKDETPKEIIYFYSLSCSGLVVDNSSGYLPGKAKIEIIPSIEIKMFALNLKYHGMPYDKSGGWNLSDSLFTDVINHIDKITKEICGARKIILYSVPRAESFYERNGFSRYSDNYIKNSDLHIAECVPMYMDWD